MAQKLRILEIEKSMEGQPILIGLDLGLEKRIDSHHPQKNCTKKKLILQKLKILKSQIPSMVMILIITV